MKKTAVVAVAIATLAGTMRRTLLICSLMLLLFFGARTVALADSWAYPSRKVYLSVDHQWRSTITPPEGRQRTPQAVMEHREQGRWRIVWHRPLVNWVMPVFVQVSNQGQLATFDDWPRVGFGPHAVVLYDMNGQPLRQMRLRDFLPMDYIQGLPTSVSSIWWGGEHRFSDDGRQLRLSVVETCRSEPFVDDAHKRYIEIVMDTDTGRVHPPQGPDWERALSEAKACDAEDKLRYPEFVALYEAPVSPPPNADERAWTDYLDAAYWRLEPDAFFDPVSFAMPLRTNRHHVGDLKRLESVLRTCETTVVIGSPDNEALARTLTEMMTQRPLHCVGAPPVYIALPDPFFASAARAFENSGIEAHQIDTGQPIQQNPFRKRMYGRP